MLNGRAALVSLTIAGCTAGWDKDRGAEPTAEILVPSDGAVLDVASLPVFTARVSDVEDDPRILTILWESNVDPARGDERAGISGVASWDVQGRLTPGTHVISVSVTDSQDNVTSAVVSVTIEGDVATDTPVVADSDTPADDTSLWPAHADTAETGSPVVVVDTSRDTEVVRDGPDTDLGSVDSDPVDPIDTEVDPPVDSDPPIDTEVPPIDTDPPDPPVHAEPDCSLPVSFDRILHTAGPVDFRDVAYAPDGSWAILVDDHGGVHHFDPTTQALTLVAATGEDLYEVAFSADGTFAWVGGGSTVSSPGPVLYTYDTTNGLVALPDLVGPSTGRMPYTYRIKSIAPHAGTGQVAILGDNGDVSFGQVACLHLLELDWQTGAHDWTSEGCLNISQGARSVAWGSNLGTPVALGVSGYLELMYYDPLLPTNRFDLQSHPNVGNLAHVVFHPDNDAIAWVMQRSGQGKVYAWEGVLRTDYDNSFGFSSWSMSTFAVSPNGNWKVFVGRNGNAWFSDSPWRPIDHGRFYNAPIPSFDQPPWSGNSSHYMAGAAFRPGTCEGLMVGPEAQGQGVLAWFSLQDP